MIAPRPRGLKPPASPRAPGAGPAARLLAALAVAALAALMTPARPPDARIAAQPASEAEPLFLPALLRSALLGDPDGAGQRLTTDRDRAWQPALSPDGTRLVYLSRAAEPGSRPPSLRLLELERGRDANGRPSLRVSASQTITLGLDATDLDLPTFSPSGDAIVFSAALPAPPTPRRDGGAPRWDVYRLPLADGDAAPENLTASPERDEGRGVLSPDGRLLAYDFVARDGGSDGQDEIGLLDLETGAHRRLTEHPARDRLPSFSPDGRHLVFRSDRSGRSQVYRIPVEGGRPDRLTFSASEDGYASYAPDGDAILFESDRGGSTGIHLMSALGRDPRVVLAHDGLRFTTPRLGPTGAEIVYAADVHGGLDLYWMALALAP